MKTMKVKPWGKGQGDHVVINESDFDPGKHEIFDPESDAMRAAEEAKTQQKATKGAK